MKEHAVLVYIKYLIYNINGFLRKILLMKTVLYCNSLFVSTHFVQFIYNKNCKGITENKLVTVVQQIELK